VTYVLGAFCDFLFPAHIKAVQTIASRVGYGVAVLENVTSRLAGAAVLLIHDDLIMT
jgi:hypothetical protein